VENLMEFAFGLRPLQPDAAQLPAWHADDGHTLSFTRPAGVSGITYIAERSNSLTPGTWLPVSSLATPPAFLFFSPEVEEPRGFLRLRVTAP
jgi:hypothetical protein